MVGTMCLLIVVIIECARKYRIAKALAQLPGPLGLPFIGNLHQLGQHIDDHYIWKLQLFKLYGPTFAMKVDVLLDGSICTSSPKNVEHILSTNHDNYIKPKMMQDALKELMGDGLFNLNPSQSMASWKYQRKLIVSMFSTNLFRKFMTTIFLRHTYELVDSLSHQVGVVVNMENIMLSLTTKFTYSMGFGVELSDVKNTADFHDVFREVSNLSVSRFTKPWHKWFWWCMPSEYRLRTAMAKVNALCYEIVDTKRLMGVQGDDTSILGEMLRRQQSGDEFITDSLIRDLMMAMMLAGRETVASGLMWIMYCLSTHPDVEQRLLEEIQTLNGASMSYDKVSKMKYLDAIAKETWRLFPPIPYELKSAVNDDMLPDGTFVPAGTNVEFSPMVMGRDETRWPHADTFRPERWLEMPQKPTAYEYPVFLAGPRACVGQAIALVQTKAVICELYSRYQFELVSPKEPRFVLGIGLFNQGGIQMIPRLRSNL